MASRSLTEVFILMRNNAIQNRHIFAEPVRMETMIDVCITLLKTSGPSGGSAAELSTPAAESVELPDATA